MVAGVMRLVSTVVPANQPNKGSKKWNNSSNYNPTLPQCNFNSLKTVNFCFLSHSNQLNMFGEAKNY